MFKKIKSSVVELFIKEQENWVLWLPIFFGYGIWSYFIFPFEPNVYIPTALLCIVLAIIYYISSIKKQIRASIILYPILLFIAGFTLANYFTIQKDNTKLNISLDNARVYGKVEDVEFYNKYNIKKRVLISVFKIEGINNFPKKVRINIKSENTKDIYNGDIVKFKAQLVPLHFAVYPNSYDFEKNAYFQEIGATGRLIGDFEIIYDKERKIGDKIDNLRNNIAQKILSTIPQPQAGIAIALLVGERGLISEETLKNLQYSGLAHLIAISGLHMVIVVGLLFSFIRFLLSRNSYLTLHYNIKKVSAGIALVFGFGYLIITGMPVSAKRAYIMIALMIISILIDRTPTPIRSLAFAAIVILGLNPYLIMSPSFRMSFSAVVGLITGFGMLKQYGVNLFGRNIITKICFYLVGVFVSSVVAEIFISPISVYYFNNYTPYNMPANLFAMPITSFWIMPLGILSFPAMLFNVESLTLIPMSCGIAAIIKITEEIMSISNSVFIIGQIPLLPMFLFTIGGFWVCIWKQKWRFFGLIPVLCGIALIFNSSLPNVIIDENARFFAVKDDSDNLYFSSEPRSKFKEEIILKKNGKKEGEFNLVKDFPKYSEGNNSSLSCGSKYCLYRKFNQKVYFIKQYIALERIKFGDNDIIVDMTYNNNEITKELTDCDNCKVITKDELKKGGTNIVYIDRSKTKIDNVKHGKKSRIWE